MAWSITSLANYNEGSGATASKTTGTLSIPANSVVLVFTGGSKDSGSVGWASATISITDSVDGSSGWSLLESKLDLSPGSAFEGGARVFRKSFTSSTSRTITFNRSVDTAYWGYSVIAITGQDTANPIVQSKIAGTEWDDGQDNRSQSVTLDSAPTSGNAVVWFMGVNNDADGSATVPSGYTVLDNPSAQFQATNAAYSTSTTTAAINSPDCGENIEYAIAAAVEVLAAGAGAPTNVAAWFRA